MQTSTTPATKPQPVVIYGAAVAALTTIVGGLTVILKDNPTAILVLGIAGVVLSGASVLKDQLVKAQVVPVQDTVAYLNDDREVIMGPASPLPDGTLVNGIDVQFETTPERNVVHSSGEQEIDTDSIDEPQGH